MTIGTTRVGSTTKLDPISFEILRHRLWAINEEAATTIKLVSGSSVATEANDMNTSLMNAKAEVFVVGRYSLAKATTLSVVVEDILEHYQTNPGIRPGDGFICNDPYLGVQHQNDVAFVMPFFYEGDLVGWAGAELHQVDVGGPVPGQIQVGAKDIYGEAPLIPPIKIVERDELRQDLEREYLRRSRTPDLLALDLRAKWAACNVARERLTQLAAEYGVDTVKQVMEDMLAYAEAKFRARLKELPDGIWRHVTYLDFSGEIYPIRLAMTKRGDRLIFDFHGTARQAPATINCAYKALVAVLRGYLCIATCWDIPWSPSAIGRAVDVITEPGTIVDCTWPAGVSKSTTSVSWSVGKTVGFLVGKMLACSDKWRDKAMASWQGAMPLEEIYGIDRRGRKFGGTLLDAMAGGGGARTFRDGIDTGGYLGSMGMSIANVESYELEYPILYLYRRQQPDVGGPGKFRGGTGLSKAYIVNGVDEIPEQVMHCVGVEMPLSPGMYGGYPSGTNQLLIKRRTNVFELLSRSRIPDSPAELSGEQEVHRAISRSYLRQGDVYCSVAMGGGGYGDPIARDPRLVAQDVAYGLVSSRAAHEIYGVVLSEGSVDEAATAQARETIRARRLAEATPGKPLRDPSGEPVRLLSIGDQLRMVELGGRRYMACACGRVLAPATENYKTWVPEAQRPISTAGPECDPFGLGREQFELREYYCPACAALLDVDMLQHAEPVLWDTEVLLATGDGS